MTKSELERIAVVEIKVSTLDERTEKMDGKLDTLVEWMTVSRAERAAAERQKKTFVQVIGGARNLAALAVSIVAVLLAFSR